MFSIDGGCFLRAYPSFLLLILLCLAACASEPATPISAAVRDSPPHRMCLWHCREAKTHCEHNCGLVRRACLLKVQSTALTDYDKYAREQLLEKRPIEFRVSDFERTERCTTETCLAPCEDRLQSCYQKCGESVTNRL
jgi:hypothetical protein